MIRKRKKLKNENRCDLCGMLREAGTRSKVSTWYLRDICQLNEKLCLRKEVTHGEICKKTDSYRSRPNGQPFYHENNGRRAKWQGR